MIGPALLLVAGIAIARWRPVAVLPLVLVLVPLRLPVFDGVNLATPVLVGAALGRVPAIFRMLAQERLFLAATLLLPGWLLLSAAWAQQPLFVAPLVAKWAMVVLAAWLAAADDEIDPRLLVVALVVAILPHALWAVAERLHWVAPIGHPKILEMRGIDFQGAVRGKALFWHPNRLAEFTEEAGLLLAGAATGGVLPVLAAGGVGLALLGGWATGSTAGMATIFGGTMLCVAWLRMSDATRRRALWIGGLALVGAGIAGGIAFVSHGGVGTREMIYEFSTEQISQRPWLGVGAGNWSLLVGTASPNLPRFWFQGHAHSLPLHMWVEAGIVGVVLVYFFFLAPMVSAARRLAQASPAWRGIGVGASFAVLGILAHNLVHYFLRDPVDGIMTGLSLGLVVAAARRAGKVRDVT